MVTQEKNIQCNTYKKESNEEKNQTCSMFFFVFFFQFTLNSLLSLIRNCARTISPDFGRPNNAILSCSVKSSGALASASVTAFANSSECGRVREQVNVDFPSAS